MIILWEPTQSFQYFKVRAREASCTDIALDVKLHVANSETFQTASYIPTVLYIDEFGFLNVEAQMNLTPNQYYTIDIVQQSGSKDCMSLYRGEMYVRSGSANQTDSKPFISYDKLDTKYFVW